MVKHNSLLTIFDYHDELKTELNKMRDIKTELKVIKQLGTLLTLAENPITDYADENKTVAVMDPSNIALIQGINADGKRLLANFVEKDSNEVKIPELEYSKFNGSCKYSSIYMKRIIELMETLKESFKISTGTDYPAIIENDYFKIMLAPRFESD